MQSGLFLNVVVRKCSAVWNQKITFQLFSCENKSLLIWGDSFFVLDLGLHILNWVGSFDIQGDSLAYSLIIYLLEFSQKFTFFYKILNWKYLIMAYLNHNF